MHGSNSTQAQKSIQPTSQKSLKKNQLPPKSSPWTGHVGTDKNLVISFSDDEDDDSESDIETKGNASRLDSNLKRPSSSFEKSNKLQLQQNTRSLHKEMPTRSSLNRTFISSMTKNPGYNSKGAGSMSLGQGSRARNFNPMSKKFASQERGHDQGAVSNVNKLQDLRHQIALRESELKLKAAQQNKESASVLGKEQKAMNLKNDTARKITPVSSGAPHLEPKEPDRKRLKLGTSNGTPQAVGNQQEAPAVKSILLSKDSIRENYYPQDINKVDHSQKEIPLCGGEAAVNTSQSQPDKHLNNSLQNLPCRSRDGDVNYGFNQSEKRTRLNDPCITFNQSAVPANMPSNNVPKKIEAMSDAVLLNNNGNVNVSEDSSTDLQSFFSMEELIDKELEEAQERRHKCEIEERNALKVYLKSQRSLFEANVRCHDLYHKRELYSAKLRSLILNNSSFSLSSGQHQHLDIGLDYLPRLGYELPTSSCQRQAEDNVTNSLSFDSNNQGINYRRSNTSFHHMTGANLGSEPYVEPDASTSEPLPQRGDNAADGVHSPLDELDTSANENEEISPDGHVSNHLDSEYHRKQYSKAKLMDIDTASNANTPPDCPQDPLLLEATLRSELFARLGRRAMKSSSTCNNLEPATDREAENEVGCEKRQVHQGVVPLSRAEDSDLRDIEKNERNIYLDSNEIQSQRNIGGNPLNVNCNAGSGDQGDMPFQGLHSTNTVSIPPLIFRSAFSELREVSLINSNQSSNESKYIHSCAGFNENPTSLISDETKWSNMLAISMPATVGNLLSEESSYGYSPAVDPFWPLCMYELRGKCNNDECPWQHAKDYGDGNIDSNNADPQDRLPLHQENCNGVVKVEKYHKATILPTYLVGLDVLKADQFAYKPVMVHRNTQCWQKHFSMTLATSILLQSGLHGDVPLSHGGDERIEVHGAWSKKLSFQWRNGVGNQIKQAMTDGEQVVETALLILNQEVNKLHGVRKALSVLSKALNTDPTSVVLWIVYLLIYSGNMKPDEEDDMFLCAVKLCEGSYELWLMYINSRKKLDDRLAAYDAALSALCQQTSADPKDRMHESACILDLFLQMIDCLCMSGNIEKAIQKSYGIFPTTNVSDDPHLLSLSDILNCLTISDKCVFWVCCVYLVLYRKLPGAVVQKFECEKDLLDIEWPSVRSSEDVKEMAVKLVETSVESIDSYVYNESVKSEVNLKSAQLFALNLIRCGVALDSLELLRNLLDKYAKLYPSCIELILVSAQIQNQDVGFDSFVVFEEAINRWPKNVPGIQCIWNQYTTNAIHNGSIDLAKEITVRWFHSAWQVQDLPCDRMDTTVDDNCCVSVGSDSTGYKQIDMMFRYLNLSLYNFLQNDKTEACVAVDKARNTVSFGDLEQCLSKHLMFLVCDALSLKEDGFNGAIKKMLEFYMDSSSQALLVPRALTRKFVDNIKKPRVQHLIDNILSPVSLDCSLLNLVLQSWYGSSLLPQTVSDPKHLVDFVEAIMEVVPENYQLAIAVCKLLSNGYTLSDLSTTGLWFWACSTLVNAILDAIPIPPEYVWVQAAGFLHNATGIEAIAQRFYRRALAVYPFSIMLWKCFHKLCTTIGYTDDVVEAAKVRGIKL
ncbi:uncharacterized protein LOC130728829 isoform X2 [Lotus japonicus]|uniref:uncharacterized protein LOC130728829 isoform X2 n=1 Tax=Lotus japonicus TaxID=34305 RepID=UPI0025874C0F|nr:uncharacterized protein LOC130728829 isoform X2 [Lotus japonicus]